MRPRGERVIWKGIPQHRPQKHAHHQMHQQEEQKMAVVVATNTHANERTVVVEPEQQRVSQGRNCIAVRFSPPDAVTARETVSRSIWLVHATHAAIVQPRDCLCHLCLRWCKQMCRVHFAGRLRNRPSSCLKFRVGLRAYCFKKKGFRVTGSKPAS